MSLLQFWRINHHENIIGKVGLALPKHLKKDSPSASHN